MKRGGTYEGKSTWSARGRATLTLKLRPHSYILSFEVSSSTYSWNSDFQERALVGERARRWGWSLISLMRLVTDISYRERGGTHITSFHTRHPYPFSFVPNLLDCSVYRFWTASECCVRQLAHLYLYLYYPLLPLLSSAGFPCFNIRLWSSKYRMYSCWNKQCLALV